MIPVQLHSIQTETVYQHDRMSMQSFSQDVSFSFERDQYSQQDKLVKITNHKIFRICEMREGERLEELLAITPKLAEMLMVIESEELLIEAKQEFHMELQDKINHLDEKISLVSKRANHLESEILKLEKYSLLGRISWVFKGLPKIDLFGYTKLK